MKLDYEKDLDWDSAVVTPLGRFYDSLLQMGYPQDEVFAIIHAVTENGVYQETNINIREKLSA